MSENIVIKNGYFETLSINRNILTDILNKDFPVKIGYWVAKIFDRIESEAKIYFKAKESLIKKYAKKDEEGEFISQNGNYVLEDIDKYSDELIDLQNIEVEINIKPIEMDLDVLESKGITFKPIEIMLLPFIKIKE